MNSCNGKSHVMYILLQRSKHVQTWFIQLLEHCNALLSTCQGPHIHTHVDECG